MFLFVYTFRVFGGEIAKRVNQIDNSAAKAIQYGLYCVLLHGVHFFIEKRSAYLSFVLITGFSSFTHKLCGMWSTTAIQK